MLVQPLTLLGFRQSRSESTGSPPAPSGIMLLHTTLSWPELTETGLLLQRDMHKALESGGGRTTVAPLPAPPSPTLAGVLQQRDAG